ncbi:hypothetical protein C8Q76DRAFT_567297, partial [Earliella scabrosa]
MSPPSFAKLNDNNYFEWAMAMDTLLTRKSLWRLGCHFQCRIPPNGIGQHEAHQNLARQVHSDMRRNHPVRRTLPRDDQSISSWVADVRHAYAATCLRDVGAAVSDEDVMLVLTNGLPSFYNQVVINLDSADPSLLCVDYIITHLLNEEACQ